MRYHNSVIAKKKKKNIYLIKYNCLFLNNTAVTMFDFIIHTYIYIYISYSSI